MRLFRRVGIMLALGAAACGKDSPTPVDFENPAAIQSNLAAVDSAFDSDVFRSFNTALVSVDVAAPQPAVQQAALLLDALRPELKQTGAQVLLPRLVHARKLQASIPNLSVAATQGRIIPDSVYGRVFEWDTVSNTYTWQDSTVTGLTGVRFVLYALGLDGEVFEPVTAIGTLDIIDESTASLLQLQVLVKNSAGTTTYVDYEASIQASETSFNATVNGFISNGLGAPDNKILAYEQTHTVNAGGVRVNATFDLNNPAITLMLIESVTVGESNIIVSADFRIIQNGETIRTVARLTINQLDQDMTVNLTVYVDGHPVARLNGDPSNPATQWVDAGGEPLTIQDLAALDDLFDALEAFDAAITGLFLLSFVFAGNQ